MEIANWLDTLLNVMVFAFIGAMLWFYLKKGPRGSRVSRLEPWPGSAYALASGLNLTLGARV